MKRIFKYIMLCNLILATMASCTDYLDQRPLSQLSPEQYLSTEDNIGAYAIDLYNTLPVHGAGSWGIWSMDNNTDNMVSPNASDLFAPGWWRVGQTGGSYEFSAIYRCNYFLDFVMPLYEKSAITGVQRNISHYIGEVYFFRAFQYFQKLKTLGDFPIVDKVLPDNLEALTEASQRAPRNEVARFILRDLDKALSMMQDIPPAGGKNRLNKDAVRLFKSRVALYEGTWLKYFKGTAFVPNGPGWPGKDKAYNSNYAYPSGDIDKEIEYFLEIAMADSKYIADKYALVNNTGVFQASANDPANPYFNMFGATNMNEYDEVLLWKQYSQSMGVVNSVVEFAAAANQGIGTTKSMLDAFVMKNGLPIYAVGSGYIGDVDLTKITQDRDPRAEIFFKKKGDRNLHSSPGPESYEIEPYPNIINSTTSMKYTTGLTIRKGLNFNGAFSSRDRSEVGSIVFRAAEAYLNYIEASYEKLGDLNADATKYWNAIRNRSKVGGFQLTIANTNMSKEGETDWAAYSAGSLVDPTLFNIRRERRVELMAEGFRGSDLRRWRSMDQMINTPYHVLGINLWDQMANNNEFKARNPGGLTENENVSPRTFSKYLAPFRIINNNRLYNGYRWHMAHYLDPIAIQHFLITGGGDINISPLYQNPSWSLTAGEATK
ncbi:RagB/SusD family nutrient uptake outer membrane protein [Sphingobacterium bovistauri]|uniref:RagB/SusD family nutrient uptake outer membrane protein n=1 Tax=Sphingobacterium bovistauri TaxID=2781959 RepID=A0ABS7Z7V6_9SPHI|nr:RagB/SusD family nutrient uptake outer membrane protein [Sphingobacterium bovistauri]MCA5006276.1 RagB/SusD family nutrient uptake outer membrane protein [Sphingobacterium bovistauri]